ncbi:uncharacterized protein LOC126316814 [Schistocerca gregaria]|uniref:uncharacterized protein LOC126316814 n=1 Tax=Schistocerca gregaria TaxID=7010 RepID=UPI00211DDEF6|nr:uncharacterized protein LOC126316814 [Schistocerca gregaria]
MAGCSPWTGLPGDIYLRILKLLSSSDLHSLILTCSSWKELITGNDCNNGFINSYWRHVLWKEWGICSSRVTSFAKGGMIPRDIYLAYKWSRISVADLFLPYMNIKKTNEIPRMKRRVQLSAISAFWVLGLYHTNSLNHQFEAQYRHDSTSYFGRVLEITNVFRIQIEGSARVAVPGYYRVSWRLKIVDAEHGLAPLFFYTSVSDSFRSGPKPMINRKVEISRRNVGYYRDEDLKWCYEELAHPALTNRKNFVYEFCPPHFVDNRQNLGEEEAGAGGEQANLPAIPTSQTSNEGTPGHTDSEHPAVGSQEQIRMNVWFDLIVGYIHVPKKWSGVRFAAINSVPDWKNGLWVDYVSLLPVTKKEFNMKDKLPMGFQATSDTTFGFDHYRTADPFLAPNMEVD